MASAESLNLFMDDKMKVLDHLKAIRENDIDYFTHKIVQEACITEEGNPLLYVATQCERLAVMQRLLDLGAPIDESNIQGYTALHLAARQGSLESMRLLLDRGASMEAKSGDRRNAWTALHVAAYYGEEAAVQLLIQRGANVHAYNEGHTQNQTPLVQAAKRGHVDIIRRLVEASYRLFEPIGVNTNLEAALVYAVIEGHSPAVECLLHYGCEYNWEGLYQNDYYRILDIAIVEGHFKLVKMLLDLTFIKPSDRDSQQRTPLHIAVMHDQYELVQLLITEYGADMEAKEATGQTPLFYTHSSVRVLELLLALGANIHARSKHRVDTTCLHRLSREGHLAGVKKVLAKGGGIDARNKQGYTPLEAVVLQLFSDCRKDLPNLPEKIETLLPIASEFLQKGMVLSDSFTIKVDQLMHFLNTVRSEKSIVIHTLDETLIQFFLLGSNSSTGEPTSVKAVEKVIKHLAPAIPVVEKHPLVKASSRITEAVIRLLHLHNIYIQAEEAPNVLNFIFSSYKRYYQQPLERSQALQCILTSRSQLTDQADRTIRVYNKFWLFRAGWIQTRPVELADLCIEKLFDEELASYEERPVISFRYVKKLCIELNTPHSPIQYFYETALDYPWAEKSFVAKCGI